MKSLRPDRKIWVGGFFVGGGEEQQSDKAAEQQIRGEWAMAEKSGGVESSRYE